MYRLSTLFTSMLATIGLGLSAQAMAQTYFYDEFDGVVSQRDRDPVRWVGAFGSQVPKSEGGDLILGGTTEFAQVAGSLEEFTYTDVSIRTHVNFDDGTVGIASRWDSNLNLSYFVGMDADSAFIIVGGILENLVSAPLDFEVIDQDVALQLDVFGDQIRMWAWPAGESQPTKPLMEARDHRIESGKLFLGQGGASNARFRFVDVAATHITDPRLGDLTGDGILGYDDIDVLSKSVREKASDKRFDMNGDGLVDAADRDYWVNTLKDTHFGDANLDGQFDSADLVAVFVAGEYEDGSDLNSTWATGDWNGDGDFKTDDLVLSFGGGNYEQASGIAAATVPEPTGALLQLIGLLGVAMLRRSAKE